MSGIKARIYTIGLCYLCQVCLHCNKNCSDKKCKCRKKKKTPENKKGHPRKYYTRTFNPNKTDKNPYNSWQLNELTCKNEYYGYNTNFSEEFSFSLCPKCHNKFNRLGKKKNKAQEEPVEIIDVENSSLPKTSSFSVTTTEDITLTSYTNVALNTADTASTADTDVVLIAANTTPAADANVVPTADIELFADTNTYIPESEDLDSSSESSLLELKFKLILKFSDGKCYPAKWEHIIVEDFYSFKDNLENLVQSQLEDQIIFQDDYIISYKYEKEGVLGTQLTCTRDWTEFLKKYNHDNKKVMIVIVTMKRKANKRGQSSDYQIVDEEIDINKKKKKSNCNDKKKKTSNQIPKEKNINETDAEIAKIVMELHSKWYCVEHDRSCYVNLTRHITLTTNHLSTWAKSINHNLATLDEPPTLPLFDAAYSVKRTNNNLQNSNIQNSNIQNPNPFYHPPATASSSFIAMPFPVYYPGMFNQQNLQPSQPTYASNNILQAPQTNNVISVPSIDEFFDDLEKKFGENTFEGVKNKFTQETIEVLDIFDLKEADWQDLGIKIGVKTKIIREAEKYRR